jgi:hypothetical protein
VTLTAVDAKMADEPEVMKMVASIAEISAHIAHRSENKQRDSAGEPEEEL